MLSLFSSRRRLIVALILIVLAVATLIARVARPATAELEATSAPSPTPATRVTHAATDPTRAPVARAPTPTRTARDMTHAPPPAPTATPSPPPLPTPTPSPRPRVGLQIGHWRSEELPDELARLRSNTGAVADGVREVDVNTAVAQRVARLLEAQGIIADVLPATVPPRYQADAFVAIHADGSASPASRGFKIATPWRASRASEALHDALVAEYAAATGLPQDGAITFNMRGYYAFSSRRFVHAIDRLTPAVIIEMGFLTNVVDRALLTGEPDRVAQGIAAGILRYLHERDPTDRAALEPPNIQPQRPLADGAEVRAAPTNDSRVLYRAHSNDRLIPFQQRGDWLQVVVRGQWHIVGWVHRGQVRPDDDPLPVEGG